MGACASGPDVDYDRAYEFAGKSTYAWKAGVPAADDAHQQRIVDNVDKAMRERGFRKSVPPDLYVVTEVTSHQELEESNVTFGLSVGSGGRHGGVRVGGVASPPPREITVGTLVIAILDGRTGELVWRATADETVTDNAGKTAQIIDRVVAKAFEDFPPVKR